MPTTTWGTKQNESKANATNTNRRTPRPPLRASPVHECASASGSDRRHVFGIGRRQHGPRGPRNGVLNNNIKTSLKGEKKKYTYNLSPAAARFGRPGA